jgi:hypothetical protein
LHAGGGCETLGRPMSPTFAAEVDSPLTRDELKRQILTQLSVPLGKSDYRIESESASGITYARSYRPYWVPAILLFWLVLPLVLLLIEQTDRIVFSISEQNGGTHLVVVGDGQRALRRFFEELEQWD